jgi:hypothetical protein
MIRLANARFSYPKIGADSFQFHLPLRLKTALHVLPLEIVQQYAIDLKYTNMRNHFVRKALHGNRRA